VCISWNSVSVFYLCIFCLSVRVGVYASLSGVYVGCLFLPLPE